MSGPLHSEQTAADGIHVVQSYEYADAAARLAATGFVASDVGRVARQASDNTFWVLSTTAPAWLEITAGGAGSTIEVKDEGVSIGAKAKLNFIGPGITATTDGGDATQANVTVATAAPVSVGTTNSAGVADSLARSDHQHKSTFLQSLFTEVTVNTSTTSTTFVTLLSQAITIQAGSVLVVHFTASSSHAGNNQTALFRVQVDGVTYRAVGERNPTATFPGSCGIVLRIPGLAAGARTVVIQWRTTGSTLRIQPVTVPDAEHASLLLEEVTV